MDATVTRDDVSEKQIRAMRRIAQGEDIGYPLWHSLFDLGLVDTELGEDDEMHDVLTQTGWKLLREIEHEA